MPSRPLIAILAIATLAGCQENGSPSSYGPYAITPVMAANGDLRPNPLPMQPIPRSQPLPGHDLANAAAHAFCDRHRVTACVTYETGAQKLSEQCSGIGARAAYIRASYVGYLANGLTRGEAISEAFNGQSMSGDEENWIGAQIVAESRQATDEQFANKITRRCVEWQLPDTPQ